MITAKFITTAILAAGLWLLKGLAEGLGARVFPLGPGWKRWLVEFAVVLPVMALVLAALPAGALDDVPFWAVIVGLVLGYAAELIWKLMRKGKQS